MCGGESRKPAGRNYGIDLLRMVSMLMVPTLHVLMHGGVLEATEPLTPSYASAWLLEVACYGAVDCFALISGYVGYGRRHGYGSLVSLCAQVLFYTVGVTVAFWVVDPSSVGKVQFLSAAFPFFGIGLLYESPYWYVTAYILLYPFMPYLDRLVGALDGRWLRGLAAAIVAALCVLPTVLQKDVAGVRYGYSLLWLAALYVLGAALRKRGVPTGYRNCLNLGVYVACVLVTWLVKLLMEACAARVPTASVFGLTLVQYSLALVQYTSPTVLAGSVALLMFFSRLELRGIAVRLVGLVAPLCFGVYLLHEEPLVRGSLVRGAFKGLAGLGPAVLPLAVLLAAAGIFAAGVLVDWLRGKLFSLLHVDALCGRVGAALDRRLHPASDGAPKPVPL